MKEVKLVLKKAPKTWVEAEVISPDVFAGKSLDDLKNLCLCQGNKAVALGELFEVSGEVADTPSEQHIILEGGDFSRFKRIGECMSGGKITINGDVGMHLGAWMCGGEIVVKGNCSDRIGAEMKGGVIKIFGNAGNLVAANYPGGDTGMENGLILIEGNVGRSLGRKMLRGTIIVRGNTGEFPGNMMKGGTIIVLGKLGKGPGLMMKRGTIIALGELTDLLPTFAYDCTYSPTFLKFYYTTLSKMGISLLRELYDGTFDRYSGDLSEIGKGEILVLKR